MNSFIHLQVRSEYSIDDSIVKVNALVQEAVKLNMPAIAVTDKNNIFAACKFFSAAEQLGIKPILGAEISILDTSDQKLDEHTLILLCQNSMGFVNLNKIITHIHKNKINASQYVGISKEDIKNYAEGLIAIASERSDVVDTLKHAEHKKQSIDTVSTWKQIFPGRFYLGVSRIERPHEDTIIKRIVNLALHESVPLVATNDVRFLTEEEFLAHEVRFSIQSGYLLADPKRPHPYQSKQYLRSSEEMIQLFADLPSAIENSIELAKRCNFSLEMGDTHLPVFQVPHENMSQDDYLQETALQGLGSRLADIAETSRFRPYLKRLQEELKVINTMGYAGYFLIVADFIGWAKKKNIPVGPGRGSGAGSLVAYALGITEMDPIKYNLIFERFLNPERVSLPDFDIDFCMEKRDQVIQYVQEKYGSEHVAQIVTYGTMAARAVIRDVGRVLGHPYGFVDKLAKLIPFAPNITLSSAFTDNSDLKKRADEEEEVADLVQLAFKLEGLCRNVGRHAGGIVIAPRPLTDFMPLYYEAGGAAVTQFDMKDVEKCGLVKFDFLGLKTLTVIDVAVKSINTKRKILLDHAPLMMQELPVNDSDTYQLIKTQDTTGIFQLESDGIKKLIRSLEPDNFEELIALIALYRPGPLQSGMVDDYVERKHGRQPIRYSHPSLEPILSPTYGVILYQEQVMQIARELSGYSMGKADLLRRAMGKKRPEEMMQHRDGFVEGAEKNGITKKVAEYIFELIEKFSGYGFNRSHSAAYALISYHTAWLKAHYPADFMAALLTCDMQDTDRVVAIRHALSTMGIALHPPCVNQSAYSFTAVDEQSIRFGLGSIKGLGKTIATNIEEERSQNGPYVGVADFCRRLIPAKLTKRTLEILVISGCFDCFDENRGKMYKKLPQYILFAEQEHIAIIQKQTDLFGLPQSAEVPDLITPEHVEDHNNNWNEEFRLLGEKQTLGFYLSGHPIARYQSELTQIISCTLSQLTLGIKRVAGYIDRIRSRNTIRGKMAEVILDDGSGRLSLMIYSEVFDKYKHLLLKDHLVIADGAIMEDDFLDNGYSMNVTKLYVLDELRQRYGSLCIHLEHSEAKDKLAFLKKTILPLLQVGGSVLRFTYANQQANCRLRLTEQYTIRITDELVEQLKQHLGKENLRFNYTTLPAIESPNRPKRYTNGRTSF